MMVLNTDSVQRTKNSAPVSDDYDFLSDEHQEHHSMCVEGGFCWHAYSDAEECRSCKEFLDKCDCRNDYRDDRDDFFYRCELESIPDYKYHFQDEVDCRRRRASQRFSQVKCAHKRKLPLGEICAVSDWPVRNCSHCRRLSENRQRTAGLKLRKGGIGGHPRYADLVKEAGCCHNRRDWRQPLKQLRNRQLRYQGRQQAQRCDRWHDDTGCPAHGAYDERTEQLFIVSKDTHYQVGAGRPGLCRKTKTAVKTKGYYQKRSDEQAALRSRKVAAAANDAWLKRYQENERLTVERQSAAWRKGRCLECFRAFSRHRPGCSGNGFR